MEQLKSHNFPSDIKFLSLDITSLFTNLPIREIIDIATQLVYDSPNKPSYAQRHFKKLLLFATSGEFLHNGKLYKQIDGVAMGSPLGPTLANLFLGHFEQEWLRSSPEIPLFYRRYVDDTFLCVPHNFNTELFLQHMNTRHTNIKFTHELEEANTISFLDTSVTHNENIIHTSVFRKPTFTGLMLNYNSNAPVTWKKALITCLISRAYDLCSSWSSFHKEISFLRNLFLKNDFPSSLFESRLGSFLSSKMSVQHTQSHNNNISHSNFFTIPYWGQASINLANKLRQMAKITGRTV